jgi:hypothetical protein
MKLTYFNYHLKNHVIPNAKIKYNLKTFITSFCAFKNSHFKSSFDYEGEHIFLFWIADDIYLFINTKSNEIIKSINSKQVNYGDVYEKLQSDETLGFASYLYFSEDFYGIAATIHGPKNVVFTWFINALLKRCGIASHEFISSPFETQATRDEAMKMAVVGKHIIEINRQNSLFGQLAGVFGCGNSNEIDSLEVIIKPTKRDMRHAAHAIADKVEDEGLKKYIIRAKASLDDVLTDYYITGAGVLSDPIDRRNEKTIIDQIKNCVSKNEDLKHRLTDLRKDPQYVIHPLQALDSFSDSNKWSNHFPSNGVP